MKLLCPTCDVPIPREDINMREGTGMCQACGEVFRIADFLRDAPDEAFRIERPPYTRIERYMSGDSFGIRIPSAGFQSTTLFMLFFTLFWNAITWFMFIMAIHEGERLATLFCIPFIVIGLVTFGMFLFGWRGMTHILIDGASLRVIWSVLGITYKRNVARDNIEAIIDEVIYAQNYRPIYGIGIKRSTGGAIKFGASLTEEERKWLIGEMRYYLKHPK